MSNERKIVVGSGLVLLAGCVGLYAFLNRDAYFKPAANLPNGTSVPTQPLSTHIAPPPTEAVRSTSTPIPSTELRVNKNFWCVDTSQTWFWYGNEETPAGFICKAGFVWFNNDGGKGIPVSHIIYPIYEFNHYLRGPILFDD